jgi:hypothetical protein
MRDQLNAAGATVAISDLATVNCSYSKSILATYHKSWQEFVVGLIPPLTLTWNNIISVSQNLIIIITICVYNNIMGVGNYWLYLHCSEFAPLRNLILTSVNFLLQAERFASAVSIC